MRILTLALLAIVLGAPLAMADEDPAGTQHLELRVGERKQVPTAQVSSRAVCDDPAIVKADLTDAGTFVEGVAPGSTLCAVRGPGGNTLAVIRVVVTGHARFQGTPAPAAP